MTMKAKFQIFGLIICIQIIQLPTAFPQRIAKNFKETNTNYGTCQRSQWIDSALQQKSDKFNVLDEKHCQDTNGDFNKNRNLPGRW